MNAAPPRWLSPCSTAAPLGGSIFSLTGGWITIFVFAATGAVMITGAWMMTPGGRCLEDKFTAAS